MVEKHDAHRDHRELEKLLFPDRALSVPKDGRKWKLNTSTLHFIGQLSLDTTPHQKYVDVQSTRVSEPVWSPVTTSLKPFKETRPMVEETLTPRATAKMIALERSLGPGFEVRSPGSTVTSMKSMMRKKKPWMSTTPFLRDFTDTGFFREKRPFAR